MTGRHLRRLLAAVCTYLVLLHAVGMGAMAAPATGGGPLLVICSIETDATAHPGAPDHTSAEHAPCALCGLGACGAVAAPSDASPLVYAPPPLVPPTATIHLTVPSHAVGSARPRGPPAAA